MTKQLNKAALLILLLTKNVDGSAQRVDIYNSAQNLTGKKYLRIHYDNDFLANNDHYYTQGISFEYANPSLGRYFLSKILPVLKNSTARYGITIDLRGYTPTSLTSDTILKGDRPFAATISLRYFAKFLNERRRFSLASAIHVGVIGPAALGEEIQVNIHRWTGNKIPRGWQHQVKNDALINYELYAEKKLFSTKGVLLSGTGTAILGTVTDKIGGGLSLVVGHFDDPFERERNTKTNYYLFAQGRGNFVGYDATLQGGLLSKSPYTIDGRDITRTTIQVSAGVGLRFKKFYLRYSQSFLTKEFRTGKAHRWGGLSAGFNFTE